MKCVTLGQAAAQRFAHAVKLALAERATGFSDREAGDFLDAAFYSDGGPTEWLAPQTSASPAGEQPTGAGVTGPDAGAAAPPDPEVLLWMAADYIEARGHAYPCERAHVDRLTAGLRDLVAQFDADAHP